MPANCSSSTPIVSLWCPKVQILAPVQDFSPPPSPLTSFYGFLIWNLNFPMILLWAPKSTCKWGKIYRALGTLRYFQELVNRTAKIYETSKTCYCIKRRPPSENGRFWKSKTELWWCVPEPGWPIADCCTCWTFLHFSHFPSKFVPGGSIPGGCMCLTPAPSSARACACSCQPFQGSDLA